MNRNIEFFEGLRIVDLTRLLPGPFATLLFADMGADVIKVEDPMRGDYARYYPPMVGSASAFFHSLNRNKRGVTLNLKDDRGVDLLRRLVDGADVLVESFRPGVMERFGLGPEKLREEWPGLVVCSITGYGRTGPKSEDAGHDANYMALSGLLDRNGRRGQPPHVPGFQLADIAGGALYAALGIASALYRRERTGDGAHLDISMTEGAVSFLTPAVARASVGDVDERGGGMLGGGLPGYRVYSTADDRYLAVAALEPKFWDGFVDAIGAEELRGRAMTRGEEGEKLAEQIADILGRKTRDEWMEQLADVDVCVEPVESIEEVMESELHRAREVFFELQGISQTTTPLTPRDRDHSAAPEHGEHTREVFAEAGVSEEDLASLRGDDVI